MPAPPDPPLVRDRDHVQREYGAEKWPAVQALIEHQAAGEPPGGSALARVHRRVVREYAYPGGPLREQQVLLDGAVRRLPGCLAVGGAERLVADAVVAACTSETDLVVELGCGWGWHVLGTWLAGGPRAARYVGAELTEAGRQAACRLAALDPDLRFDALAFDYLDPTLEALGRVREAVVFTAHSIEQIPHLPPAVPQAVAALADTVRCLHFEPVGWQVDGAGTPETRAHAERHDYNRDLISVLRDQEAAGVLAIEEIATDVVGLNPVNATTLVRWRAGT